MHKDIISRRSPFFKAACAERWAPGGPRKDIELPEDKSSVFASYLQCVYQDVVIPGNANHDFCELVELYAMADKLGDLKSANLVVDKIMDSSDISG